MSANAFDVAQHPAQPNVAPAEQGTCNSSPHEGCDEMLVRLVDPLADDDAGSSGSRSATIDVVGDAPLASVGDFDLQVFASNVDGQNLGFVTGERGSSQSGELVGEPETITVDDVMTTRTQPEVYMRVQVIRFLSQNATYSASVSCTGGVG